MTTSFSALRLRIIVVLAAMLLAPVAHAQILRAYVSSTGNDANPCNIAAPCRLLPAALNAVANGGEIWMLDSANYNTSTVTIGKSVSILAVPGAVGSIVAFSGPAISITAASLKVGLRNLVIVGLPGTGGTDGVSMTGVSSVSVESTLFANLGGTGINIVGAGSAKVANSVFRNNGSYAVLAQEGAKVDVTGTQMLNSTGAGTDTGVFAYSATATTTLISISDSLIAGGSESATAQSDIAGATARVTLARTTISNTQYGPAAITGGAGSAVVTVNGCTIQNNGVGWYVSNVGAAVRSHGNNVIADNTTSSGALTTAGLQ
jgi:hypothetical protein